MTNNKSFQNATFKELEQAGWHAKATTYDDYAGQVTVQAVEPLLDVAQVTANQHVLDIACGPGYVAGGAAARGAIAIGVDFAPAMIVEARKRVPGVEFREGDAEALSFADNTFDAVICPFGMLHIADPDTAIAEAYRVLRPGGHYAFTVWATPDKHEFFAIVLGAIQAHGRMDVPLPPAPSIFRFSNPEECNRTLSSVGFEDIVVQEISTVWKTKSERNVLDLIENSAVRTPMLIGLQEANAIEKINKAILEGTQRFKTDEGFEMAWPVVMTSATKPN